MKREELTERSDWREKFETRGFYFHSLGGTYWDETACYHFSSEQIDLLESATQELHKISLAAVEAVIANNRFSELGIPQDFIPLIKQSWQLHEKSLFGRFDLCYDGTHPPKLLEYNADTPTSLIEASVAQWNWLEDVHPEYDQFNSLHEKLIERWKVVADNLPLNAPVYFSCAKDNEEDLGNLEYLRDTALQAGIDARFLFIEDIGWDEDNQKFVDLDNTRISALFKLYPWEWLMNEEFAVNLLAHPIRIVEPAWKILLSNKGILAILWEMFPNHPNLLPCYFDAQVFHDDYVKKPLFSREGANVSIYHAGHVDEQAGDYGAEGFIYQAYAPLPKFSNHYTVIGSWIIGDQPAGIGIREDETLITKNTSRFLPHYFS
jgi:glutathionylspermidine synthase